jgi:hypothetical protein
MRNLDKLLKDERILGLTNVYFEKDRICRACQARKQVGVPHPPKSIMTTTQPFELIHMDLFGPVAYLSLEGNKYELVFFMIIPASLEGNKRSLVSPSRK